MLAKSSGDRRSGRRAQGSSAAGRSASRRLRSSLQERSTNPFAPRDAELSSLCNSLRLQLDTQRRRLARALHDSPAQAVSAAMLTLFLLEREKGALSVGAQRALQDAQALLASCGDELRRISHELYPPLLDEVGLAPPLRSLARTLGTRVRLQVDEVPRLGRRVEEAAFRFVEEALTSVVHGRGPVTIEVISDRNGGAVITIEGRARSAGQARRLGVISLQQRLLSTGAELIVRELRRRSAKRLQLTAAFHPESKEPAAESRGPRKRPSGGAKKIR